MLNRREFVAGCVAAGAGAALPGAKPSPELDWPTIQRLLDRDEVPLNGVRHAGQRFIHVHKPDGGWWFLSASESDIARSRVEKREGDFFNVSARIKSGRWVGELVRG